MQKLVLKQSQQQRLSPQQIQFIKLLQIPITELSQRIEEELEINPALEEKNEFDESEKISEESDEFNEDSDYSEEDIDIKDLHNLEDYGGYKMSDSYQQEEDRGTRPVVALDSLHQGLENQLGFLKLSDREEIIGKQLIGSIEDDGYIRRPLRSIRNDLAFSSNFYTNEEEIEEVLKKIQKFEPAGIGARDLQECLLIQISKKPDSEEQRLAAEILTNYFEELSKKHYEKIQKKLDLDDNKLRGAVQMITRLNPKPGNLESTMNQTEYLQADFIITRINGQLEIFLNSKDTPELKVSRSFTDMLKSYSKADKMDKETRETLTFVKDKIDSAKWFIDAIKQRKDTLLRTMYAILEYQIDFFENGDESNLRPMILKDIAEKIEMDISTVSRVVNSKAVQTDFGLYPLKYFFSEGISTDSGEDVSSREVKNALREVIDNEPKNAPYSDEKLEGILREKGYKIARRTIAKYRDQLGIQVARLRKEI